MGAPFSDRRGDGDARVASAVLPRSVKAPGCHATAAFDRPKAAIVKHGASFVSTKAAIVKHGASFVSTRAAIVKHGATFVSTKAAIVKLTASFALTNDEIVKQKGEMVEQAAAF